MSRFVNWVYNFAILRLEQPETNDLYLVVAVATTTSCFVRQEQKEQLQLRTLLGIPEVSARTSILFVISVTPVKLQCKTNIGEDLE